MRIGFDAKRFFNNSSGLGNYSRNLLAALKKYSSDDEFILYTPSIKAGYQSLSEQYLTRFSQSNKPLWRQFGIVKDLVKDRIDLYHGLSAELPNISNKPIRSIVTIHDIIYERYPHYYSYFDRLIYRQKTKRAIQQADHVVTISQTTKDDLVEVYGLDSNKCSVIPVICNKKHSEILEGSKQKSILEKFQISHKYIFCLGKFERRKNQLRMLKAFHNIKEELGLNLVLAGAKGDMLNEIQKYIEENELHDSVKLILSPSDEEVTALYQASEFFVFPSEYEGFGMPVLEAMLAGKVVVTSKNTSMQEIAGESGLYFEPESIVDMARVLLKTQDQELMSLKRNQIKNRLFEFSEEKIAKTYLNLYKRYASK